MEANIFMSRINIRDISEDYSKAQRCRRKECLIVKRANRKVMTIHLGGIYIECLLKSIIIRKYGIVKSAVVTKQVSGRSIRCICWYNQAAYNRITSMSSINERVLLSNKVAQNTEHDLVRAFRQIDELYNSAPGTIITALEYLNKPVNKKYIDYRYVSDDELSDVDYHKWEENFLIFLNYFDNRKSAFTFRI